MPTPEENPPTSATPAENPPQGGKATVSIAPIPVDRVTGTLKKLGTGKCFMLSSGGFPGRIQKQAFKHSPLKPPTLKGSR